MANFINDNVPLIHNCSQCGKEIKLSSLQRSNYRIKGVRSFYCNRDCYYKSRIGHESYVKKNPSIPIEGVCYYCKKPITLSQTQRKRVKNNKDYHIHCSKECYDKGKVIKITIKCDECGKHFIASESQRLHSWSKTYCNSDCYHKKWNGERNPRWNGGKITDKSGYIYIYSPNHPNTNHQGYVFEHRLVVEKQISRYLTKDEVIHHKDENKSNNDIENLQIMTNAEHVKFHYQNGKYKLNGVT